MLSSLSVSSGSVVVGINGVQACNIIWAGTGSATIGTSSTFLGRLVMMGSITMMPFATTVGALFSRTSFVRYFNHYLFYINIFRVA